MSVENGRRLSGKEYVEILAWILAMVMSNWYVAWGCGPSTLGFEVIVAGAAEIKQLDQRITTRSNQKSVMSKRAHAVYEVVVCWIFVCGFVGPWRSEIVEARNKVSTSSGADVTYTSYRTVRSPHAARKTSPGDPAKG